MRFNQSNMVERGLYQLNLSIGVVTNLAWDTVIMLLPHVIFDWLLLNDLTASFPGTPRGPKTELPHFYDSVPVTVRVFCGFAFGFQHLAHNNRVTDTTRNRTHTFRTPSGQQRIVHQLRHRRQKCGPCEAMNSRCSQL